MSKANLTLDEVVAMLDRVADKIIASEPELSEADRNIGDGDHGLGMQRAGGKALKGQEVFDSAGLATFLQAAVQGVQDRGKAEVGDKTVVDAMVPAAEKAKGTSEGNLTEALAAAADAAEGGKEASKDMVAKFGRAKTLGDGAVGYPDAGALSFTIIMQAMRDYVNE